MTTPTPFTLAGFRHGLTAGIPLAAGALPYGIAFGALAIQQGFEPQTAAAMSAIVYSGAAQFAALQVWSEPLLILPVLFACFAMNARYILYGALLRPHMTGLKPWQSYPSLFVLGDANWALMMRDGRAGRVDGAFALGSGLAMYAAWLSGTWLGSLFGRAASDDALFLRFLLPIYFATLLVGLWRGRGDLLPLLAAAVTAVLAERLLGSGWSVVCGGLAGMLAGMLGYRDDA